jgi:hypothetical protein
MRQLSQCGVNESFEYLGEFTFIFKTNLGSGGFFW